MWRVGVRSVSSSGSRWKCTLRTGSRRHNGSASTRRCFRGAAPQLGAAAPGVRETEQRMWNGGFRGIQAARLDALRSFCDVSAAEGSSSVAEEQQPQQQEQQQQQQQEQQQQQQEEKDKFVAPNVSKLCEEGKLNDALEAIERMAEHGGADISPTLLARVAEECRRRKSLAYGRRLQATATRRGLDLGTTGWTTLVRLYAACGSLADAEPAFRMITDPAEHAWQTIILAHANAAAPDSPQQQQGQHPQAARRAVDLYKEMRAAGVRPATSVHVYVAALKSCAATTALADGRQVHADVREAGLDAHEIVANAVMNMYAKCGSMAEAQAVFDNGLKKRDGVAWTVMITGHVEHGGYAEALAMFDEMRRRGAEPNRITYQNVLRACAQTGPGALDQGRKVHSQVVAHQLGSDVGVSNSLISMYCKCGSVGEGRDVFDRMPHKTVVSWNAMIGGYARHRQSAEALELLEAAQAQGVQPNGITFKSVLNALDGALWLEQGRKVHALMRRLGVDLDALVGGAVVDMYARCGGSVDEAREVFESLVDRDAVAWTAMVRVCEEHGKGEVAVQMYREMVAEGVEPSKETYVHALRACGSVGDGEVGAQIHARLGNEGAGGGGGEVVDAEVGGALVDMYARCGDMEQAQAVFDKLPEKSAGAWDSLIAGYAAAQEKEKVAELFGSMLRSGVRPSARAYASMLKTTTTASEEGEQEDSSLVVEQTRQVEAQVTEAGLEVDANLGTALIGALGKSGGSNLDEARKVYDKLGDKRTTASCNALMGAYIAHEKYAEAIDVWRDMRDDKIAEPDRATFVHIFKACTKAAGLAQGRFAHLLMLKMGIDVDEELGVLLIDMYSECGRLSPAKDVFDKMPQKTLDAWDALITGHSKLARGDEALDLLAQMKRAGVQPEPSTVARVLSACSHAEMVYEGWRLFDSLAADYGVDPGGPQVCAGMVDMLGRAGYLDLAARFVDTLVPQPPDAQVWGVLLRACANYADAELGRRAFDALVALEPRDADAHIVMANLYAKCAMPTEEAAIKERMRELGLKHQPGRTFVEAEYNVHGFFVEDQGHQHKHDIYSQLWRLAKGVDELDQPRRRVGFKT